MDPNSKHPSEEAITPQPAQQSAHQEAAIQSVQQSVEQPSLNPKPIMPNSGKNPLSKVLWIFLGLVLLGLVAGGAYYFGQSQKSTPVAYATPTPHLTQVLQ